MTKDKTCSKLARHYSFGMPEAPGINLSTRLFNKMAEVLPGERLHTAEEIILI